MIIKVNKETKRIEGYTDICLGEVINQNGYDLFEVEIIPNEYSYYKYENEQFVYDEEYKTFILNENKKQEIRIQRESECFPFINRGYLWYSTLNEKQVKELRDWYQAWLDAPTTLNIPNKLSWL